VIIAVVARDRHQCHQLKAQIMAYPKMARAAVDGSGINTENVIDIAM
jgi:hypothetical protein